MKPRASIGVWALIALMLAAVTAGLLWQRLRTTALRVELEAVSQAASELPALRAENARLREKRISAAELEALRADRAALPRLRAEIEALQKRP